MINDKEKNIIGQWIDRIIQNHEWPDHDLHIDIINPNLKRERNDWLNMAIEYYRTACEKVAGGDFRLVLVLGLASSPTRRSLGDFKIDALKPSDFSTDPPSLYLYDKNDHRYELVLENIRLNSQIYRELRYSLYQYIDEDGNGYNASIHLIQEKDL